MKREHIAAAVAVAAGVITLQALSRRSGGPTFFFNLSERLGLISVDRDNDGQPDVPNSWADVGEDFIGWLT